MKICCITNDVEALSLNGQEPVEIAEKIQNESLPALLNLYKKYDVKATFYCLGSFAEQYPDILHQINREGHEIACHGYVHDKNKAFDVLPKQEQIEQLKKSKKILESISGSEVVSFRAPALRVNADTPEALISAGFKTDSSISPQRMDMFLSFGAKSKLQWFRAPRAIYETAHTNLARRGNSGIIEVPVSAFILPYIGTLMRISPVLNKIARTLIYWNTKSDNSNVVCFLYHPSEAVRENKEQTKVLHRSKNLIGHLFGDIIRTHLKRRNLGPESLMLLEKELKYWKDKGYSFKTVKELI